MVEGDYSNYKLGPVNMICVPGIFYGSEIKKGTVKLDYYVHGSVVATAEDKFSNGKLICTEGPVSVKDTQIGNILYNQGIIAMTSSESLVAGHSNSAINTFVDNYFSTDTTTPPSWLNFGTGIAEPENSSSGLTTGSLTAKSACSVSFKGTNKVPTLTMFAFSEKGEHNFSHNPTFLENDLQGTDHLLDRYILTTSSFQESETKIKKINKSKYQDAQEDFQNVTYISKVGIYDENKNLIAIATLANPAKKTDKRDFMIKMKIDF